MKEKPELLANQSYDQKRAKAAQVEERWAANNWKNDRLNEQFGTTPSYKEPVKVYEVWQKVYCSPELKAKARKLKNGDNMTWLDECQEGQCCMYLATIAGGLLVRETYLPYHLYPCTAITLKDGKLIGPAPVEDIIAANKSLDVQVSRKEQYVNQVVAGRVLKHKSTKITRMTNAHGDFLEWDGNPTEAPVIMGIPDLPSVVQSLQNDTERFMDEATVMGNQLMNVVQGGRGAEAIESLKGADVESVSTGRKKVAYALQQLCEVLSMLADVHQSTKHQISRLQEDGQPKAFSIIGGRYADTQAFHQAYDGYEGLRPTVIRASAKVSVTIESGLAYTQQGKFNILQNLASMGALSVESLLTMLKVTGNVSQELRQILQESGRSMIDTEDFKALPPDFQVQVLQQLQQLNISMPVQAKNIGSTRNIDTPQVRS